MTRTIILKNLVPVQFNHKNYNRYLTSDKVRGTFAQNKHAYRKTSKISKNFES